MRALSIVTVFFGVPWLAGYAAVPPSIEIPVTIREGASVSVPFAVSSTGTHHLELQYRTDADQYFDIFKKKLLGKISGTLILSCEGKSLQRELPTGWIRPWGPRSGRVGTVIVRFRADTQKRYVCLLRMKHVPSGLPHEAFVVVRYVTPHFHPGHHVYELQ
jgi:hypothetical protein